MLHQAFFARPVLDVARELIGTVLSVDGVGGAIVEVEAYAAHDPASHSFNGPTPRTTVMFGMPGRAYVYRSYGLHWCLNFVCGDQPGGAVLVRAIEPLVGVDLMIERRGTEDRRLLCSGPGRLCQALGVTGAHNGLPLDKPPFVLEPATGDWPLAVGVRVGIRKGMDLPWRFGHASSRFLSRPLR
jgi:DNA-3-methyladenine glycosylase